MNCKGTKNLAKIKKKGQHKTKEENKERKKKIRPLSKMDKMNRAAIQEE